jgi:hypothetical protein
MMKQPYGEGALARSAVFKWNKRFAQGRDSFKDDEHTGGPRTVRTVPKIEEFATLVLANRSQTVDKLQEQQQGLAVGLATKKSVW